MTTREAHRRSLLAARPALSVLACIALAPALGVPAFLAAQTHTRSLTLEEALALAEARSPTIAIARAAVLRAEGERLRARSEAHPQLSLDLSYQRTLASEFDVALGGGAPATEPCPPFTPDPAAPPEQRLNALEGAVSCISTEDPFSSFSFASELPFGRAHRYALDLNASQLVYAGGRVQAQKRAAEAALHTAEVAFESERARLTMEVAQAYWDAQLADRLLAIAQETLELAERTLADVRLGFEIGEEAEFEVLRAQVTRDTQEPVVIQRRAEREAAHMRLRRLVGLPLGDEVALPSELEATLAMPLESLLPPGLTLVADTAAELRAPVRREMQTLRAREAERDVARAQRRPSLSVFSTWTRVAYPRGWVPGLGDVRPNWTVTAQLSLPLYTGGRTTGDVLAANAEVEAARARLELTRELAAVDSRRAEDDLAAAAAALEATSGTVEQARRAYDIAQVRFVEGLGTQLEVTDARIQLEQASANRAVAARNYLVARLRMALLPFLPLVEDPAELEDTLPEAPAPAPRTPEAPQAPFTGGGRVTTGRGG